LEQIILKTLAKNREDRYPSCRDIIQAIQSMASSAPEPATSAMATMIEPPAVEPVPTTQGTIPPAPPPPSSVVQSRQNPGWNPWAIAAAGMLGFGLLAILVIWFIFSSMNKDDEQSVSELVLSTTTEIILETAAPTQTNTPMPSSTVITETSAPTDPPTITPEPTLGIGDTLISPVDGSVMVFIPAGEFLIGAGENDPEADPDELPQKIVYLDAFWIDQYEVTNQQYQACVSVGACKPPNDIESATRYTYYGDAEFDDFPVINVTWFDAADFCHWRGARLPTEAEWEKAARGSAGAIYPWGDTFEDMHSNYCAGTILCPEEPEDGFEDTAPVGSFLAGASPYGVQDMAGNVNEWVEDWYDENYYASINDGVENPPGPDNGEKRAIRGGSFGLNASKLRTTNRGSSNPAGYGPYVGFRCVQTP
jgi:formylglycine-generating enzyme required for sulfatase activity